MENNEQEDILDLEVDGQENGNEVEQNADELDLSYLDPEEDDENEEDSEEEDEEENDEDDEYDDDEDEEDYQPRKKNGFQKRIGKLVDRAKKAENEKVELLERLRALEEEVKKPKREEKVEEEEDDTFPVMSDYDYDEGKFYNAVYKYNRKKEIKEEKERARVEKEENEKSIKQEEANKVINNYFGKHVEEAKKTKYKDFDKMMTSVRDLPPLSDETAYSIFEDEENGVDVHYYLMKNPSKWKEISEMPTHKQIREITKLSDKIGNKKAEITSRKSTNDYEPIERVKSSKGLKQKSTSYESPLEAYRNSKDRLFK